MALKRAGRGHDPEGIENTQPGSLTVECPACPHPGRNLPENWRDAGLLMYVMFPPFFSSKFLLICNQVSIYFVRFSRRKFQVEA
jgi:hypothetical protein